MWLGVRPGSPAVVSGALANEVPKCTRFWKHWCHGLSPHEGISEISEPVLYELQFEVEPFL